MFTAWRGVLVGKDTHSLRNVTSFSVQFLFFKQAIPRWGEETRSGTERRCSHDLQSGHPAWWSADNCSIFPTVNIFRLFRSKKRTGRGNQKCLRIEKIISCIFFFLAYSICLSALKLRGKLKRNRLRFNQQQCARSIYL